jgi:hypothetical protein
VQGVNGFQVGGTITGGTAVHNLRICTANINIAASNTGTITCAAVPVGAAVSCSPNANVGALWNTLVVATNTITVNFSTFITTNTNWTCMVAN